MDGWLTLRVALIVFIMTMIVPSITMMMIVFVIAVMMPVRAMSVGMVVRVAFVLRLGSCGGRTSPDHLSTTPLSGLLFFFIYLSYLGSKKGLGWLGWRVAEGVAERVAGGSRILRGAA